ncbi:hypothetical protein [Enterovibrio norvegicus]|uniref:Uncharacterized protein n=1 Tax=Enterovibrio norvegicus TaxID=188144 RepID=A0ABV4KXC1_9GAMM|nr:hypothetical protein [Enterovibrio norvegicus]OEF57698.1 hypothetical protein A1OU_01115 [Enterovibrio norvegicus]
MRSAKWNRTPVEWGILTVLIGGFVIAAIPVFEGIVRYADKVEFRYLANAFQGAAQNVYFHSRLSNASSELGRNIVVLDGEHFRLTDETTGNGQYPFALEGGAKALSALTAQDCGALFEAFTGQSYWLEQDTWPRAFSRTLPRVRAVAVLENGTQPSPPYCRFERPVHAGFMKDGSSDVLINHVFAYYPASGRVEVLNKSGERQ